MTERAVRRRYVLLAALHYLPVGVIMPVNVLLLDARGLSIGTIGVLFAFFMIAAGALELPTGGLADTWGRRPVVILAGLADVAGLTGMAFASTVPLLLVALFLLALGQALYSGPLEAWYVDQVHAEDPAADVTPGLARGHSAQGLGLAVGALAGGTVACVGAIDGVAPVAIALLGGYLLTGPARPLLSEVLHREVNAAERATVLSAQSIVLMMGAFAGSLLLPALAGATSTGWAMLVAGIVIAAASLPLVPIARRPAVGAAVPAAEPVSPHS